MPKDKCLQNGKVVGFLLNALYQVYVRVANSELPRFIALKHDISNILLLTNMGYEKIAK